MKNDYILKDKLNINDNKDDSDFTNDNTTNSNSRNSKNTDRINNFYGKSILISKKKEREKFYESLRKDKKVKRFNKKRRKDSKQIIENDEKESESIESLLKYLSSKDFSHAFDINNKDAFQENFWKLLKNVESRISIQSRDINSIISLTQDINPIKQLVGLSLIKKLSLESENCIRELIQADIINILAQFLNCKSSHKYVREALIILINMASYPDEIGVEMINQNVHIKICEIIKCNEYSDINRVFSLWCLSNLIISNDAALKEFQKQNCCDCLMEIYDKVKHNPKKVNDVVQFILSFFTFAPEKRCQYELLKMFKVLIDILIEFHTSLEYEGVIIDTLNAFSKFSDTIIFGCTILDYSKELQKVMINLISSSNESIIEYVLSIISNHIFVDPEIQYDYIDENLLIHLKEIINFNNDIITEKILFIIFALLDSKDESIKEDLEKVNMLKLPVDFLSSENKEILRECIWCIYGMIDTLDINELLINSLAECISKVETHEQIQILKIFDSLLQKGNNFFQNPYLQFFNNEKVCSALEPLQYSQNQVVYDLTSNFLQDIYGDIETLDIKQLADIYLTKDSTPNITF